MALHLTRPIAMLALLLFSIPPQSASARASSVRQVTWDGLSQVVGHKVRVVMPDGTLIEGRAGGLEVDGLRVDIRRSSNQEAYPSGPFLLPRATLRAVDVVGRSAVYGRVAGTALGIALGAVPGAFAVSARDAKNPGGAVGYGVLAAGLPVIGYFLGRAADRRVTTYLITP